MSFAVEKGTTENGKGDGKGDGFIFIEMKDDLDRMFSCRGKTLGEDRYREWVKGTVPEGERKMIREAVKMGRPTGSNRFAEEISEKIGRRVELRKQGRPRKDKK